MNCSEEEIPFDFSKELINFFRPWYLKARWNEVYDVLEHLLRKRRVKDDTSDANPMLSREGSAYRFVGDVIVPITDDGELAVIEEVAQLSGPFSRCIAAYQASRYASE